jgi:hypothetical protein
MIMLVGIAHPTVIETTVIETGASDQLKSTYSRFKQGA